MGKPACRINEKFNNIFTLLDWVWILDAKPEKKDWRLNSWNHQIKNHKREEISNILPENTWNHPYIHHPSLTVKFDGR